MHAPPSEVSVNLMDTPDDRNLWSRSLVEVHLRYSRRGRCQSALVSRNSKKESIVSRSICTLPPGMIAGLVSLDDSRHRGCHRCYRHWNNGGGTIGEIMWC